MTNGILVGRATIKPGEIAFKPVILKCPECGRWHSVSPTVLLSVYRDQVKVEDPCRCLNHTFTIHPSMPLPNPESFDKINDEKKPWHDEVNI